MTFHHAVLLIDHQHAELLQFDAGHVETHKLKAHSHHTRQHGSDVRTEHEFFAQVCNALPAGADVLVAGGHQAQIDFRHYLENHRPQAMKQIVGWETVDHPSEGQLLVLAKKQFNKVDKLAANLPIR